MVQLRTIAISSEVAAKVRETMSSPGYGHPATASVAKGHGPCRVCLRSFVVGEDRRILFTFNSFAGLAAMPQPGPVFVHERECERFAEAAGYPSELMAFGAVLDGYDDTHMTIRRETVLAGSQEAALELMFADQAIRYVMVRDAKAGCYDFRVERRH